MKLEEQVEAINKSVVDFKELHSKELAEIKKNGQASAETLAMVTKANDEITRVSTELKAMQTAMNRSGGAGNDKQPTAEEIERKAAFNSYIRKGIETKALSANSDPDGGYLVLPEMAAQVVKKIFESSPVRQLASVQTISSDSLEIIEDLDEAAAGWVAEQGTRSDTGTPQLKKLIIPVHELYAFPKATQKILDDANINIEQWLAGKIADKLARVEATAFVAGTGVNQPRGFTTYAAGTTYGTVEQVNSGSAAVITADGIISLVAALKTPYRQGASFMMKRVTVASVRKLKDSQNRYLWEPGLQAGNPDMLLGYPIYEADDMAVEAASALPIAFANWKAAYQIVDRFGIRTLRDPYSAKPYVGFYSTKRVGGDVANYEAIKLQKCST